MNVYVYIAMGIVLLLVMALCAVAGSESDIEELQRKEGQTDGCNNLFGTDKETGQDDQKQTE